MVETSAPRVADPQPTTSTARPAAAALDAVCPYLLAADGRWRSAGPSRDHRCTAVNPAAILAADKQRRLCLAAQHVECATYQVATGQGELIASGQVPAARPVGLAGRHIVRTAPLVLDQGRLPVAAITADRRIGQAALLALMAVAFAAILLARVSDNGTPSGSQLAGGRIVTTSPTATTRPDATPAASAHAPARTLVPTEVEPSTEPTSEATAEPEPTAEPSGEASPRTYKVKRGDTLSGIATEFGTTVAVLKELNDIKDVSKLRVGQVIKLP